MKALVYTGAREIALGEMPDPRPAADEVRVAVRAAGICGSDMHAFLGHDERRPPPLVLGHEAAGVVLDGERAGTRVAINPLVTCGSCAACRAGRENLCPERQILSMPPREGAFAERVSVPVRNLVALPDHVSFEVAAMTEPLACGWHAVRLLGERLHGPAAEAEVLVIGGGAIGVSAALALQAAGVARIVLAEPNAARRERIARLPGLAVVDPADAGGAGANAFAAVVDAVGVAATRAHACAAVRPGGVIVHIGLGEATGGLDVRRMTLQEIDFVGTYTYTMADFRRTAEAIAAGRLGPLDWFEPRDLGDGPAAFDDILAGRVAAPKIVLRP